jgi:DNA repair protein RadC
MFSYSTIPIYSLKLIRESNLKYPVSQVNNSEDSFAVMQAYLQDKESEHLACLLVDNQNNLVGLSLVAMGGTSRMQCGVRDCFKFAIAHRAHAIILGHNHPSGSTQPSPEDIAFTKEVKRGGEILGIPLTDHIIVSSGLSTRERPYSFFQQGRL